jgi:transposase-like protein
MGKRGKLYPPECKEEAIGLVRSSDESYPVAKIARDLGVSGETCARSGSTRPTSRPESAMDSPPRRKKSCAACAKR